MAPHLIDPSNVETARAWDGSSGDSWVAHADIHDLAVARYLPAFRAAAAIGPGMRVLDVGCGNGQLTIQSAAAGASVTGVDLSAAMLACATRRAAGAPGVEFRQADVQVADLGAAAFDRVISRNGTMFFGDPVAAFTNLRRALRPDGRLVMQVWQPYVEQEWLATFRGVAGGGPFSLDGPSPVSLGDPDTIRAVLGAAGFAEPTIVGHAEPMWFGADVEQALKLPLAIIGSLFDAFDDAGRAAAVAALRGSLAAHLNPDGVTYGSAAWLVTATPA